MERIEEIFNDIKLKKQGKLLLKVKTGAKRNSIDGLLEMDSKEYLKISIKSLPIDGKANKMIIEFLAKEFGLSRFGFKIKVGKSSSYKMLEIHI